MKKTIIKTAAVLLVLTMLMLGFATWRYPFSAFSLYHAVTFDQHNLLFTEYRKELQQFKNYYHNHKKQDDVTSDHVQYILQAYQIPFLTNDKAMKISIDTLDEIIAVLRKTRDDIVELAFTEKYDEETRNYLKLMLIDFLSLEEQAQHVKNASGDSRKVLHLQIRNLRTSMQSNLGHLATFYKLYIETTS